MNNYILATNNQKKLKELQQAFPNEKIVSYTEFCSKVDIDEVGESYKENALIKAKAVSQAINQSVIGDDGGLELKAYPTELGLYTSRFFEKGMTDRQMNEKLLDLLKTKHDRSFELHACLVWYVKSNEPIIIEKVLKGHVSKEMKGHEGYGFDTILIPEGYRQTLSELSTSERNKLSPRNQAFEELIRRNSHV